MDEKEFLREKEKLSEICKKLESEEKELEDRLSKTESSNNNPYVQAHLAYLGHQKIVDLRNIKSKPYFARIDFKANGENVEKLYIGKISIIDSKTQEPIIIDWRAPISNLYYSISLIYYKSIF